MVPALDLTFPSLGGQVCDWIEEHLVFGPGDLVGQPAQIDDEKRALIWRMYEVYPKSHPQAGRRRFKRTGISLRKGSAKTEVSAWIAAVELHPEGPVRCIGWDGDQPIGGPVTDPYVALVSVTEEQSEDLAYGGLRIILERSAVAADFDIGLERILRRQGDGKAVALASAPDARDGARTTHQVFDETHRFTLPRLVRAHRTMLANVPKRMSADAWSLETTTAPEPGTGSVAESTMDYARAVESGKIVDAQLFFFHRQASDSHDLSTPEGVRAAVVEASGPGIAGWSDIDTIAKQWQDPTNDRAYLERVWLNRLVQAESQAFDVSLWEKLATSENPVKPGDQIVLGFDGALFFDSVALTATHIMTGYQWVVGLWEQPHGPAGKDWSVPELEVDAAVRGCFERFKVWRMYADPPYWQSWIAKWAGEFGAEQVVEFFTTRRRQMAAALENFDTAIKTGGLSHGGDSRLKRHIANSRKHNILERDEQGKALWLIRKERPDSPYKIDLAMAAVLSWEARTHALAAGIGKKKQSVYATRGVIVV